jgi:lipopolysaccharide export system protein LptA
LIYCNADAHAEQQTYTMAQEFIVLIYKVEFTFEDAEKDF